MIGISRMSLLYISEVAQEVARALKATISPEAQRIIETKPTSNTEAYELFLKANELDRYVEKENTAAVSMLEKAVELDPNFSSAWAQIGPRSALGGTYMSTSGMNPEEAWKISKPYLEKALALDKDNGGAHRTMAWSSLWYEWDFETAKKEYAETQRIFPNYSWPDFHLALGQFEQAYVGALACVEIDSRNFNTWTGLILSSYFASHDPRGTLRKGSPPRDAG
jgi:tetratricopeptide (TPR) repeat protein